MTTFHVIPVDDLVEHETDDNCPCNPIQEAVVRDDGSINWVASHNAKDGRS